jgi:rare lipoprotein A
VNDRGPFKDDRVIDLSLAAAKQIGLIARGTSEVRLEVVEMGEP